MICACINSNDIFLNKVLSDIDINKKHGGFFFLVLDGQIIKTNDLALSHCLPVDGGLGWKKKRVGQKWLTTIPHTAAVCSHVKQILCERFFEKEKKPKLLTAGCLGPRVVCSFFTWWLLTFQYGSGLFKSQHASCLSKVFWWTLAVQFRWEFPTVSLVQLTIIIM